jgi:hypothetical protein
MYTIYLIENRVDRTKTLVVSDKRFSSFVADIEDRKTKNIEELQSSIDLAYLQSRLPHYLKTYKIDNTAIKNPHHIRITSEDRRRLRIRTKRKSRSEESKKRHSESVMGEKNPFYGRKHTARTRAINSMKQRQRLVQPHAMPHRQESKDKYRESRKNWKPNTGKKWAYDPYTLEEKFTDAKNPLPPGWVYGRSPAFGDLMVEANAKRKKR